ncbi:tRNA(Ile2) 2-agmatinylcytidine synthetase [Haladaptatus litoreus]|uniref:tRNA(Ile2) 2-agmatinylcytidine synthetase TiaS n=1 Tax=Haladaptatus litoreus TaxID=553468 RepID=A0A1N7C0U0_9EURY|nr:tRNA(Ile)(2)-agmatinylcytidine synthase [Haladaptatus litoreus]SIR57074.1 tRNA(Ile2) 2-agmatinylcytidine synthetase [Haladaptatus litoreus]
MTVIGLDDTDSRERGMCTTYLAARIADGVRDAGGDVERLLLIRLNPAVKHKTRGNAALAIHTDLDPESAFELARKELETTAETDDPNTNPGLVIAPHTPENTPSEISDFARRAVRTLLSREEAERRIESAGYRHAGWKNARGKIGALAAVGSWNAFSAWTHEHISYRESEQWGTPRDVDVDSVFEASNVEYPTVWDTVDRGTGEAVCIPHTPCPILYGIRGDDPDAVRRVATKIEGEPVTRTALFVTNQGTDAHLRDGTLGEVEQNRAYRITGTVVSKPETRRGGHVFFTLASESDTESESKSTDNLPCAAFEPTKRFRDHVRNLRPGDEITVCGEVSRGTLKLEKFAVRSLKITELVTPNCPECRRSMKSAGAGQGYRCRGCKTQADGKVEQEIERELESGWYEVPPEARRHIAKPLVRGGFDGETHPER